MHKPHPPCFSLGYKCSEYFALYSGNLQEHGRKEAWVEEKVRVLYNYKGPELGVSILRAIIYLKITFFALKVHPYIVTEPSMTL
jgi:hypothetical protein